MSLPGCGSDDAPPSATPAGGAAGQSTGEGGGGSAQAGTGGSGGSAAGGGGEGGAKLTPKIDLRADTDRNGVVDLTAASDDEGEEAWDKTHGAVLLANIDDDLENCKVLSTTTDVDMVKCNDAADEEVNGDEDLLDLARLKTAPWAEAPEGAVGQLTVDATAASHVRLFKKTPGAEGAAAFVLFRPDTDKLSTDEVRQGVELAIEASDIVRDLAQWDGYVTLTFTITQQGTAFEGATPDVVKMRVSPVMTHHHLQPTVQAYVAKITNDPGSLAMRNDLRKAVDEASVPNGLTELSSTSISSDQWTQDYFETGYMAMPTADGKNHVMRVAYRSANVYSNNTKNPLRPAGRVVFSTLRGKDFAGVAQYTTNRTSKEANMDSLNSFGNTETIPPYTLDGKSYPQGRVFRGSVKSFYPDKTFATMLESQQVQPPVYVDTSWLLVGHVDETVSFLKVASPRGWALVVNDAAMAKKMLEDAVAAGHGDVKMFVGKEWATGNGESPAEVSIQDVLNDKDVLEKSLEAVTEVDNQVAILKKETGITDDEIIRLPYLHESADGYSLAYQPGTVNGIYLSDTLFGAPRPHGPVIDGVDIFEKQMTDAFAKVGVTVKFIEDWDLYHRLSGEVHCGSNVIRQVADTDKWWESGY